MSSAAAAASTSAPNAGTIVEAAPQPERRKMTMRERRDFIYDVSASNYLKVLKKLQQGMTPNEDWRGLLPMRTAVLKGDIDMVALLLDNGGRPHQFPKGRFPVTEGALHQEVVLGKSAFGLASQMAADEANPMASDAQTMLYVMRDQPAQKRRLTALRARLEEEAAREMRQTSRNVVLCLTVMIIAALCSRFFADGGDDSREL